jgi:hypothetical protein
MRELPRSLTHTQRLGLALGASTTEFLGLAALVLNYESGGDMTPILKQLLDAQDRKRSQGITPTDMRAVLNGPTIEKLRLAVAKSMNARGHRADVNSAAH